MPARPPYCELNDVLQRMYSGQSTGSGPAQDNGRDALLNSHIVSVARRFDKETGRPPGGFAPVYDVRYYSGKGSMWLRTEELVAVQKVEYNTTPGRTPSWIDVTGDFATSSMQLLPIRHYPKDTIWRINAFVSDPYRTGNIRVTGIFGNVQPDQEADVPAAPWQGVTDQSVIDALAPPDGGWWVVSEDVIKANAEWVVYTYKSAQAGYSDTAGDASAGQLIYRKGIPPEVARVISAYPLRRGKVGMVTADGEVLGDNVPGEVSRWASWTNAPGSSFQP